MRNVVITGPTGAIGTAIIEACREEGISVYAVVRKDSKRRNNIPVSDLVTVVECEMDQIQSLPEKIQTSCDAWFHLAWKGTTGAGRNDYYLQNENVKNTLESVETAKKMGCKIFIGAGSQAEYGRVEGVLRADTPTFPETGYGMAKLCAGFMSRARAKELGILHTWVRILSVYGKNDGDGSLIMTLIHELSRGGEPEVTKGEQIWDYLNSKDAARAMLLIAKNGLERETVVDGKTYVLGSGTPRPLAEYMKDVRDVVAPDGKIGIGKRPYPPNPVMHLEADVTPLQKDLGWSAREDFRNGIREIFQGE